MHRAFLFLLMASLVGCASTPRLARQDAVLDAYTRGLIDGAAAARGMSRPVGLLPDAFLIQ
jgi:type IV pilus biogenesis protein CpaD/CtpE